MRETFTSGSVGGAPGNRCFYPEADGVGFRFTPAHAAAEFVVVRHEVA